MALKVKVSKGKKTIMRCVLLSDFLMLFMIFPDKSEF